MVLVPVASVAASSPSAALPPAAGVLPLALLRRLHRALCAAISAARLGWDSVDKFASEDMTGALRLLLGELSPAAADMKKLYMALGNSAAQSGAKEAPTCLADAEQPLVCTPLSSGIEDESSADTDISTPEQPLVAGSHEPTGPIMGASWLFAEMTCLWARVAAATGTLVARLLLPGQWVAPGENSDSGEDSHPSLTLREELCKRLGLSVPSLPRFEHDPALRSELARAVAALGGLPSPFHQSAMRDCFGGSSVASSATLRIRVAPCDVEVGARCMFLFHFFFFQFVHRSERSLPYCQPPREATVCLIERGTHNPCAYGSPSRRFQPGSVSRTYSSPCCYTSPVRVPLAPTATSRGRRIGPDARHIAGDRKQHAGTQSSCLGK